MSLVDDIANTLLAPAPNDLVYVGQKIGGGETPSDYQNAKSRMSTLLGVAPSREFSSNQTLVLSDAGSLLVHPSSDTTARTITIPSNAAVAFPVGTCIVIRNRPSAGALTIAITDDTLLEAGSGASGSRTVAPHGMVSITKDDDTTWVIQGVGVT